MKGLISLQRLHLERTKIGDDGVAHLSGLVNLEYLNLYSTGVSDKAIPHLSGLRKLRRLYVWETRITDEGKARLKKALPRLEIVGGVDLSTLPKYASGIPFRICDGMALPLF